ncbi:MAG: hypothetical protein AAGU77_14500, partial [Bacillota bacterium]
GAPMACADMPHASLMGAAMLGIRALGGKDTLFAEQAGKTIYPRPEMTGRYAEKFSRYLAAYECE